MGKNKKFMGEDAGFAINGGKGWKSVTFNNHQISLNGPTAQAMGDYIFVDATRATRCASSTPLATSATTTARCASTSTTRRCRTRPKRAVSTRRWQAIDRLEAGGGMRERMIGDGERVASEQFI